MSPAPLPALFTPGPRAGLFEAVKAATDWGRRPGLVLVVVRRPVPYGQADPAVFLVEPTP